jgi:hypothetical protein
VFVHGKPFQRSLMIAGKARVYPSEAPCRCSTKEKAPGLTHKHVTRLERLTRDKHSSLLRKFVNYGRNKFYDTGPAHKCWNVNDEKTFLSLYSLLAGTFLLQLLLVMSNNLLLLLMPGCQSTVERQLSYWRFGPCLDVLWWMVRYVMKVL